MEERRVTAYLDEHDASRPRERLGHRTGIPALRRGLEDADLHERLPKEMSLEFLDDALGRATLPHLEGGLDRLPSRTQCGEVGRRQLGHETAEEGPPDKGDGERDLARELSARAESGLRDDPTGESIGDLAGWMTRHLYQYFRRRGVAVMPGERPSAARGWAACMNIERVDLEVSARSSVLRTRVLIVLADVGVAHAGELAELCRISTTTLRKLMHGAPDEWSIERAPITLGLVVEVPHARYDVYAITQSGREWASEHRLVADRARRLAASLP